MLSGSGIILVPGEDFGIRWLWLVGSFLDGDLSGWELYAWTGNEGCSMNWILLGRCLGSII